MNFSQLKTSVFAIIQDNDPYKESKKLHLRNWCFAFLNLFTNFNQPRLSFVLDVLSDGDCWLKTDSIHQIELNRKVVAKKMVHLQSWTGKDSTLSIFERFQIACWCCLEEDIVALFEDFKRQHEISDDDTCRQKWLVKKLSSSTWSDPLTIYWSHIVGKCVSGLKLDGKHIYEYGLEAAFDRRYTKVEEDYRGFVEAIEFFWSKIKSLPEDDLRTREKYDIFIKTAVRAAGAGCANNPEIFEYCFIQLSHDHYSDLLERASGEGTYTGIFYALRYMRRFDYLQKLFDCQKANFVLDDTYRELLAGATTYQYSENYATEAEKLFVHVWMKEGFERHRALVLRNEMCDSNQQGSLLTLLVTRNYMKAVWAVLDEAAPDQLRAFMRSESAHYIHTLLKKRDNQDSLSTFISYDLSYWTYKSLQ